MPATYSIQVGTIIESFRKPDIFNVLQDLPNNTQKLIKPRDVRDAFLSTWANSAFKVTTPNNLSNFEYIGLDSGDPNNRDIKNKILLGKRSFGSLDVLNSNLLNSDTDIFIYNTKSDSDPQNSTKVSLLAGTDSVLFQSAPYIESFSTASTVDLNLINPSGSINILSQNNKVSINGITFPAVSNTQTNLLSGRVLKYVGNFPNGELIWETPILTTVGTTASPTNLYGSPSVYVNDFPLEFIEDMLVPQTIGGVTQGSSFASQSFFATQSSSFQNWPLVEVLRKIIYPELEPELSLSVNNSTSDNIYAEVGQTGSFDIDWSVTTFARDNNEHITDITISQDLDIILTGVSFIGDPGSITESNILGYELFSATAGTYSFILETTRTSPNPTSSNIASLVEFIYPAFSGFELVTVSGTSSLKVVTDSISKLIEPYPATSTSTISQTFIVTVQPVNGINRYFINGVERPVLTLVRGGVYTFDQSDLSNTTHPLRFRVGGVGSAQFTSGVVVTGTPGLLSAQTVFTVPDTAPSTLQYYCTNHPLTMGNTITVITDATSSYGIVSGGSGYFYLIYPDDYPTDVILMKDPNNFIIYDQNNLISSTNTNYINSFTYSLLLHPDYGITYSVWRTTYITGWSGLGEFKFEF